LQLLGYQIEEYSEERRPFCFKLVPDEAADPRIWYFSAFTAEDRHHWVTSTVSNRSSSFHFHLLPSVALERFTKGTAPEPAEKKHMYFIVPDTVKWEDTLIGSGTIDSLHEMTP
jgi:hypothetical protein